jgi:hypothetical protein
MKINNKSKVVMDIFHQARRQIALIAGLLGQFVDEQRTQIYDLV